MVLGSITLAVNGEKLRVHGTYDPSTRLIDVLRSETRFTGPKVGCGEGGCGACTVLVDRFDPVTGAVSRCSVNSCLATLGSCDGAAVTTAEGLGNSKCGFHPAQEALAKRFGSQCGYCTPGVVVALAAAAEQAAAAAAAAVDGGGSDGAGSADSSRGVVIARGLDGNLCRCTGWRPIIDAARDLADLEDLHKLQPCRKLRTSCRNASSSTSTTVLPPPATASFPAWLKQYVTAKQYNNQRELQLHVAQPPTAAVQHSCLLHDPAAAAAVHADTFEGQKWLKPVSLNQLAAVLRQHCGDRRIRLVAGNTGSGVYKDLWPHDPLVVDLGDVNDLKAITFHKDGVMLGAGVTIQQLISVLRKPSSSSGAYGACIGSTSSSKMYKDHEDCTSNKASGCYHHGSSSSTQASASALGLAHAAAAAAAVDVGSTDSCIKASALSNTKAAWAAMADHLERIAGVHVRSAATLGGHFGLLASKPLPTDIALVLAAAGAWVQVLHIGPQERVARANCAAAAAAGGAADGGAGMWGGSGNSQPQDCSVAWQQQQQQQLDLQWVTVEDYLTESCVGSCSGSGSSSSDTDGNTDSSSSSHFITADGVAGGKVITPEDLQQQQQQQQQQHSFIPHSRHSNGTAAAASAAAAAAAANGSAGSSSGGYKVVTAIWLPYGNETCELFWSYKVALRHVNSHALVNAAMWVRFDPATVKHVDRSTAKQLDQAVVSSDSSTTDISSGGRSSSSSTNIQPAASLGRSPFAGAVVTGFRLFVGFPPSPPAALIPPCEVPGAASSLGAVATAAEYRWQEEHWTVLKVAGIEETLEGDAVSLKGMIAALRQLETQLSAAGLNPTSYHAQTLQGLLLKALVPLLDSNTLPALPATTARDLTTAAAAAVEAADSPAVAAKSRLLRLLQLPEPYNPKALPQGRQILPGADEQSGAAASAPVHLPVEKDAVRLQASGEAAYAADVAAGMRGRVIYLACVKSTKALAEVHKLDAAAALSVPGVIGIITAADIPGRNEVFGAPLLADGKVEYVGQPIALLAASTQAAADRAASLVNVSYGQIAGQTPIVTIDQAIAAGSFYDNFLLQASAVRTNSADQSNMQAVDQSNMQAVDKSNLASDAPAGSIAITTLGSTSNEDADIWQACQSRSNHGQSTARMVDQLIAASPRKIMGGRYSLPAQQHMYMETQVAVAEPLEDGCMRVTSATQSLDAVQQAVAAVLGVPFNKVSVVAKRLGGGFGGKASRSMPVAAAAALAASMFNAPVCYSLNRNDDFAQNGGRCSGRMTYDVGFQESGRLLAIKAEVLLRAGAYFDLASNDGAQLLAASDSAYDLSGLHVIVKFARCNLPPHTIMRGPGYLQGVMVLEQILEHVAAELGMDAAAVKAANFLPDVATSPSLQLPSTAVAGGLPLVNSAEAMHTKEAAATEGKTEGKTEGTTEPKAQITTGGSINRTMDSATAGAGAVAVLVSGVGRLCIGSVAALQQRKQQQQQQHRQLQVPQPGHLASGSSSSTVAATAAAAAVGASSSSNTQAPGVTTLLGRFISSDSYTLPRLWKELLAGGQYTARLAAVQQYNREHAWSKRGIAVTPVRFDCAPAAVSAALTVFADGSVLVTHGGIEMGQGLSTKVKQAAVAALGRLLPEEQRPLPLDIVRLAPSSSDVVPNGGPTWSSTGSEGNCQAVMNAAAKIVEQMAPFVKVGTDGLSTWRATLAAMFPDVGFAPAAAMLSAYGYFDGTTGTGSAKHPVQYSAFGAAMTEVEFDVLTGERRVCSSHIMYDCGYALNPGIDLGQVEGAFVMGLGVMLCEDVVVDDSTGELLTGSTWNYKIPTPDLIPQRFTVQFLADAPNPRGILSSKASGEPALMTSTSALMALQQAATAAVQEVQALADGVCMHNIAASDLMRHSSSKSPRHGSYVCTGGDGRSSWCVLPAPATPQKLKGVVGSFSIADALESAAEADVAQVKEFQSRPLLRWT